jgi:ribosomal protein S18 acetylase RimI-like enzyme
MDEKPVIRDAMAADGAAIVAIGRELVEDGDTFVFPPATTDDELKAYWLSPAGRTFVALVDGATAGCYFLRSNYPGRGRHVANVSYAVARRFTRRGIGRAMAEHSLEVARFLGYQAMQFNLVVSTNEPAVTLWRTLGFRIVGTLPKVFDHPTRGLVDAYVMHRFL